MIKEMTHLFFKVFSVLAGCLTAAAALFTGAIFCCTISGNLMEYSRGYERKWWQSLLAVLVVAGLWLVFFAAVITVAITFLPPEKVYASVPKQAVGFRVERVGQKFAIIRPIYPMKLGGEIEGTQPKEGELLTCSVKDEEQGVEVVDSKGQTKTVSRMVIECVNGTKIRVIGVEY